MLRKESLSYAIAQPSYAYIFVVNGNWGKWGEWSQCSKTCGGGQHLRTRKCNNPAPAYGGKDCVGAFRQRRLCNQDNCPGKPLFNF